MSREKLLELTRRTMAHAKAGTVPLEPDVMRVPVSNYYDPERWTLEMDRIFKRVPLTLGFSCELAAPGAYKAMEVAGVPVLLTRHADGAVRAFVNMCSHRGAVIMKEGGGSARRFTCPYHAWSYDPSGDLVGILDRAEFGEVDSGCLGLTPLPVAERAGLIFAGLTPGRPIDIDAYLCGYDEMLGHLDFAKCRLVGRQALVGPNWKVAFDGYLDFYHLPILHKDTFGADYSNKAIYDAWGPHQRVTSPDHRILALDGIPEDELTIENIASGVWTIFPHISVAAFDAGGRMYMVSQLFPGDTPDESVTVQNFLAAFEPDDAAIETMNKQMAFLLHVVRDEDYYTGNLIQRAVKTGAKTHFIFGRNEGGGQRFHRYVDALVGAADDEAYRAVLAAAQVVHQ
jgi:nitrite reductase/ring-hydroxylating ferredoxin subunit